MDKAALEERVLTDELLSKLLGILNLIEIKIGE